MSKVPVLPPSGFRDFLPAEASARQKLEQVISETYLAHGFQRIGMAVMESLSTLQGKGGGSDNEKLIFKVLKRGEELTRAVAANDPAQLGDMGLRFDLTLPLARYCARFREQLPKPFKVFQVGSVWRADRPQKGRYREFVQCDVDIVGAKELGAEVDCISAILEVFRAVNLQGVEVHLNDRRLLAALRGALDEKAWAEALITLDKLDKVGPAGVEKELSEKLGHVPEGIAKVLGVHDVESFRATEPEAVASLDEIVKLLREEAPGVKVVFNPSLVRGQDYYTGTIFEIRHPGLSGSLGGGGRYNRLLEIFGAQETPAFGGSIGFERLFLLLQEKGALADAGVPHLFIPLLAPALRGPLNAIARDLRNRKLRVDVFPDAAKLKAQFKYADDRKIPFTLIVGEEELRAGQAKLKNMSARTEETVALEPREEFLARLETLCRT
jgi:histidyl-tRNA synthetase